MNHSWQNVLDQTIDEGFARIVETRRHLHMNPELSGEERATSLYLYQMLDDIGLLVRMGAEGRGVIVDTPAELTSERGVVALRADIDALRIHDEKRVAYRSQVDGVMHACGHDAHTATVLGAVMAIDKMRRSGALPWPVQLRAIFQPAEETCAGAKQMIGVGALDDVKAILAAHVDPTRPVGHIGVRKGVFTAACDEMTVVITGRGGHAARPHEASDPIAAAAQFINALYLFIPRRTDSQDAVVVTIGQVQGGHNANVIPEAVTLRGTVRTLDHTVRDDTIEHIRRLSAGIGQMTETQIVVEFGLGCHSVRNAPNLVELLQVAGSEVLEVGGVERIPRASMGSEDFAFYCDLVPAAMFRLGCSSARVGDSLLHTPTFDVDDEALRFGAKILARAAIYWSDPTTKENIR